MQWGGVKQCIYAISKPLRCIPFIFTDFCCGFGFMGTTLCLTVTNRNYTIYTHLLIAEIFQCTLGIKHTSNPPCIEPQCLGIED